MCCFYRYVTCGYRLCTVCGGGGDGLCTVASGHWYIIDETLQYTSAETCEYT